MEQYFPRSTSTQMFIQSKLYTLIIDPTFQLPQKIVNLFLSVQVILRELQYSPAFYHL